MKRTKTFKAAAILCIMNCALTMPSCTNDDTATGGNDGRTELRLSSGLTVQEVSRAGNDLLSTTFDKGNNIDVFIYEDATTATTTYGTDGKLTYTADGNNGLTTYNADNTENKQYWPASGNGVNIYAYYPSDVVSDAKSSEDVTFTVKTDQSSDDSYKASDLMYGTPETGNPVARTSNEVNVQFNHLLSKVTITLQPGSGMTADQLAKADVLLQSVLPSTTLPPSRGIVGTASGTAQAITVIKDGDVETVGEKQVVTGSCIVPPQTLTAQFVMVKLESGGVLLGGLTTAPTLSAGNEYKYNITVNLTGLDITGTIKAWDENNEQNGTAKMNLLETIKAKAEVVDLSSLTENTTVSGTVMLTSSVENKTITIADDATVLLSNASITTSSGSAIKCSGDATIYLEGKNTAKTTDKTYSKAICGIEVGDGNLTIDGNGSLEATGGMYGAGIGAGYGTDCGNITINGGSVTAIGGSFGAGIGSGYYSSSSCREITINGGSVTAIGGMSSAGIGSGSAGSSCEKITISGGTVTATGGSSGAAIGCGYSSSCSEIAISGGSVTATGGSDGAAIGSGSAKSACEKITISGGTIIAMGGENGAGIGSGSYSSSCTEITISGGTVTATGGSNGAGIGSGSFSSCSEIAISDGSVTATGGSDGAGIGSGNAMASCDNIKISGGTIEATGGSNGAGIGSGSSSSTCYGIEITSGIDKITVAKGSSYIGAGSSGSKCGDISIDDEAKKKIYIEDGETLLYSE